MVREEKPWDLLLLEITDEQVIEILKELGSAYPIKDKDGNLVFQSVCHESQSWKLCYYRKKKNFFCYKEWESFNLYDLIMKVVGCDFGQAFKMACEIIGFNIHHYPSVSTGFFNDYVKEDWDTFERYSTYFADGEEETVEYYDDKILSIYSDLYYKGWIDENISVDSMKKYNIKYDVAWNRIIIPHYDINNRLIGIRCRNLDVDASAKYCPVQLENKWYSHSLSQHLYGLNRNKDLISRLGKVMIVESEKGVQQAETYFPNNNFVVACCGSNISNAQIKLLLSIGVKEVQLGMDFDFHEIGDNLEYLNYQKKIYKLAKKLVPYFSVYYITAYNKDTLGYKYSPTDFSKELLIEMMKRKNLITYKTIEEELPKIEKRINYIEGSVTNGNI